MAFEATWQDLDFLDNFNPNQNVERLWSRGINNFSPTLVQFQAQRPPSHHINTIIKPFLAQSNPKFRPNPNVLVPYNIVLDRMDQLQVVRMTDTRQYFGTHVLHILLSGGHPPLELFDLLAEHGMALVYQYSEAPSCLVATEMGIAWNDVPSHWGYIQDTERTARLSTTLFNTFSSTNKPSTLHSIALRQTWEDLQMVPVVFNFISYALLQPFRPVSTPILNKLIALGHQYPITQTLPPQLLDNHMVDIPLFPYEDYLTSINTGIVSHLVVETKKKNNGANNKDHNKKKHKDNKNDEGKTSLIRWTKNSVQPLQVNSTSEIQSAPSKAHQQFLTTTLAGAIKNNQLLFPQGSSSSTSPTTYPTATVHPLDLRAFDILAHVSLRSSGSGTLFDSNYSTLSGHSGPLPPSIRFASVAKIMSKIHSSTIISTCLDTVFCEQSKKRLEEANEVNKDRRDRQMPGPGIPTHFSPFAIAFNPTQTKNRGRYAKRSFRLPREEFPVTTFGWLFGDELPYYQNWYKSYYEIDVLFYGTLAHFYAANLVHFDNVLAPYYSQQRGLERDQYRVEKVLSKRVIIGGSHEKTKDKVLVHKYGLGDKNSHQINMSKTIGNMGVAVGGGNNNNNNNNNAPRPKKHALDKFEVIAREANSGGGGSTFASVPKGDYDYDDDDDDEPYPEDDVDEQYGDDYDYYEGEDDYYYGYEGEDDYYEGGEGESDDGLYNHGEGDEVEAE